MILQRLFSTFPDGWPGYGLLLQRFGMGVALICLGVHNFLTGGKEPVATAREFVAVMGGIFLVAGFLTPITGTLIAIDELWIALSVSSSQREFRWIHVLLALPSRVRRWLALALGQSMHSASEESALILGSEGRKGTTE